MGAQSLGSRAILGRMYQRLEAGNLGWAERLSFYVDSDQESEEHKWLGMSPALREWIGGRHVHGLRDNGIIIVNKKFEASISISVDEIRRDKTRQVMARVDDLAGRANTHGAKLLSELILAGESTVCYDGQFFFDDDHSEGDSGTQSNDITTDISALPVTEKGSTTIPSPASMQQAILKSIQQMLSLKDDQGEPINEMARDFVVMVPIPFWTASITALGAQQLAGGETNVLANLDGFNISLVANPRLTWTTKFATFRADDGDGIKPFIRQEERPLEIKAQAEDSKEEFDNDRHVYGVNYNGNYGFGFWQHACLNTLI